MASTTAILSLMLITSVLCSVPAHSWNLWPRLTQEMRMLQVTTPVTAGKKVSAPVKSPVAAPVPKMYTLAPSPAKTIPKLAPAATPQHPPKYHAPKPAPVSYTTSPSPSPVVVSDLNPVPAPSQSGAMANRFVSAESVAVGFVALAALLA